MFSVQMSDEMGELLVGVARRRGVKAADVVRKFIKLGLLADRLESDPDRFIAVYDGEKYEEVRLFGKNDEEAPDATT